MEERRESRKCSFRIAGPPKESLGELCKCTKFTKREIQVMYRTFKQVRNNNSIPIKLIYSSSIKY